METERPTMTREMTDWELDLAIMRDVLGFSPCSSKEDGHDTDKCYWVDNDGSIWRHGGLVAFWPSREIEDAWLVVEEMGKRGWNWSIEYWMGSLIVVFSNREPRPENWIRESSKNQSVCRAICEAALAALESERAK